MNTFLTDPTPTHRKLPNNSLYPSTPINALIYTMHIMRGYWKLLIEEGSSLGKDRIDWAPLTPQYHPTQVIRRLIPCA